MATPQDDLRQALQHWQASRFREAETAAKRVLRKLPDQTDALNIVGHAALQRGLLNDALVHLGRVVTLKPNFPPHQNNLGEVYRQIGRLDEAIAHFQLALRIDPQFIDAMNNLGLALQQKGQFERSAEVLRHAVTVQPQFGNAWLNLSTALLSAEKKEDALLAAEKALALAPQNAVAHQRRGMALRQLCRFDQAIESLRTAIALAPDNGEAHLELGQAYEGADQPDKAIESFGAAQRLMPDLPKVYYALGPALARSGRLDDAVRIFREGTRAAPNDSVLASNLLFGLNYTEHADPRAILQANRDWSRRFADPLSTARRPHTNDRNPERRLRVGYVSPDFREHCQSFFTLPLLANHDRNQIEVFCYSDADQTDQVTQRLRACAQTWRPTAKLTHEQLAQLVRDDRIDILIDLTMHMAGNRLLTFARKPAPVQICWLAYPGTTGLDAIDYRISDPHLDPPGTEDAKYSEQTLRLPDTFWCYDPLSDEPVSELPASQANYITFGCLNNFYKVNEKVLHAFARVLAAVQNSRLILLAPPGQRRQATMDVLSRAGGVAQERVEFIAFQPRDRYLTTYHRIDVVLDTFPVNGHTTSLDALWMGVPVVTQVGPTVVGRAGLSQMHNLGLIELVAEDEDEFVRVATDLARDLSRLAELRRTLRPRMTASPLMDAKRFARNMESAYRECWRRWCANR